MMKNTKKRFGTLGMALLGMLMLAACSKDKKDNPNPTDPTEKTGNVSATLTFEDTGETIQFTGYGAGSIVKGAKGDTVAVGFGDKETSMAFFFMFTPAEKGNHVMGKDGFMSFGMFNKDSLETSMFKTYVLGWENYPEGGQIKDAATFNITSVSDTRIKGTFTATMIQNSIVMENGEVIQGEIKQLTVTNGKFDVPLIRASSVEVR